MVDKEYCTTEGCYFSEDGLENSSICPECFGRPMADKPNDKLFALYDEAVHYFEFSEWFREEIRSVDTRMNGNYEHDLKIYKDNLFEQYNKAMLGEE